MTHIALDDIERLRFDWPEPVLIDLIGDSYGEPPDAPDRLAAARIHTRFLRALIDGDIRPAAALRVELIACCAARGIEPEAIARADQAAFLEIVRIVRARFRNSPKVCLLVMKRLHVALGRLPTSKPARAAVPGGQAWQARMAAAAAARRVQPAV